ncbi:MAG: DNA cytosine methyltransferase [Fusobacteriaceae bacterium]
MKYNVGSLFAGVGGICLGFKRADSRYKLVVANEIDEMAIETYKYNFNHNLVAGDIQKILNPQLIEDEVLFLEKRKNDLKKKIDTKIENKEWLDKLQKIIKLEQINYLNKTLYSNEIYALPKAFNQNEEFGEKITNLVEYYIVNNHLNTMNKKWVANTKKYYEEKREQLILNPIDVLTGGFPCQAFSIAGERKGFSDYRGELFYSIINLVKQLDDCGHGKPRVLFLENVKNLISHDDGNTFKVITNEIEKLGYKIKSKILNTCEYTDLPQNRERIFIVCFLNLEDYRNFGEFEDIKKLKNNREKIKENLKNILDYKSTKLLLNNYYYTKEKYPLYFSEDKVDLNIEKQINEMYEIYQIRRGMYIRKNQSGVCPTLTANMGTGGHNVPLIKVDDGVRKLTPTECFDLQGFGVKEGKFKLPNISNAALYKQVGNAVSVSVIELIAKKIIKTLEKRDVLY